MSPGRVLQALSIVGFLFTSVISATAQEINTIKAGVVRIENTKQQDQNVGTGFVVKINGTNIYVVTAAHIVRGDQHPNVYLFNQGFQPLSATVIDMEEDDVKGLALLLVNTTEQSAAKLVAIKLRSTSDLGNGENVRVIGFPGGTSIWTVDSGTIKRLEGRNLVLSGAISGGNSGGPIVLGQHSIGLVTDVSQADGFATRAESLLTYVNGFLPAPVSIDSPSQTITLTLSLDKIVVHQDGSIKKTSWNFEVFAGKTLIIPLGERGFDQ